MDKNAQKWGPKFPKKRRQVGAFCKFWPGHTGGPFIFCPKTRFLRFFVRLRGWCNITPSLGQKQGPPNARTWNPSSIGYNLLFGGSGEDGGAW